MPWNPSRATASRTRKLLPLLSLANKSWKSSRILTIFLWMIFWDYHYHIISFTTLPINYQLGVMAGSSCGFHWHQWCTWYLTGSIVCCAKRWLFGSKIYGECRDWRWALIVLKHQGQLQRALRSYPMGPEVNKQILSDHLLRKALADPNGGWTNSFSWMEPSSIFVAHEWSKTVELIVYIIQISWP